MAHTPGRDGVRGLFEKSRVEGPPGRPFGRARAHELGHGPGVPEFGDRLDLLEIVDAEGLPAQAVLARHGHAAEHLQVVAHGGDLGLDALLPKMNGRVHAALLVPVGHGPEALGVDIGDKVEPFPAGPGEDALDVPVDGERQPEADVAAVPRA